MIKLFDKQINIKIAYLNKTIKLLCLVYLMITAANIQKSKLDKAFKANQKDLIKVIRCLPIFSYEVTIKIIKKRNLLMK